MNPFFRITLLLSLLLSAQVWAMDYMWEEKFSKTLPLAEKNDPAAQYDIGVMYLRGRGVSIDNSKAIQWLKKAANQSHHKAQYKLATMYLEGAGTGQNNTEAAKWLKKSAQSGYPPAQFQLGKLYEHGKGVSRDRQEAVKWYTLAADRDYQKARQALTKLKQNYVPAAPAPTPVASAPKKTRQASVSLANSRELLLKGKWLNKSRPALHLPSARNKCTIQNSSIICLSENLKRQEGIAIVTFQKKSTINSFARNGQFNLVENDILLSAVAADFDPSDEELKKVEAIKMGKQGSHKLSCKFTSEKRVSCDGKDSHPLLFTRR